MKTNTVAVGEYDVNTIKKKIKCRNCKANIEVVFFEGEEIIPTIVGCDRCSSEYSHKCSKVQEEHLDDYTS